MAVGSFSKYLSGFTSDHTYQTATITNYCSDGTELTLTGMTWNLLNKGRASDGEKHGNNPFDLDEDEKSYIIRKKSQLKFIWKFLNKGDVDFFCLQEVDIFFAHPRLQFVEIFLKSIHKRGWKVVASSHDDNMMRPLLILFDATKLEFINKRGLFPSRKSGKFTGMEALFKFKGKEICITNIHLDFESDHREEILKYQMQQIANNHFTVIAGDANHTHDKQQYSLVGDMTLPTNVYRVPNVANAIAPVFPTDDQEVIQNVRE